MIQHKQIDPELRVEKRFETGLVTNDREMKRRSRKRDRHKLQRVCLERKAQDVKEKLLD